MKLIVAGSRDGWTEDMIHYLLDESIEASKVTEIVSGGARGVDKYGETWAYENNVEVKLFPANWKEYGKSAGYRRNTDMARYADALIAFWDGQSKGTEHMINIMSDLQKPTMVIQLGQEDMNEEDEDEDE